MLVLERRCFLKILYDALPDRSRVRLGSKVMDIYDGVDGVEVMLADGTCEKGDMVIGCDGVHSLIRETMWDQGNRSIPGLITVQEKKCKHPSSLSIMRYKHMLKFVSQSCNNWLVMSHWHGAYGSRDGRPHNDMRP